MTRADVEAATGLTFTDGTFTPGGLGGNCFYEQQRPRPDDLGDRVVVQLFTGAAVYDEFRANTAGAQDVQGLGDRAFASHLQVVVLKGNRGFLITWDRLTGTPVLSDADKRERLITLARAGVGQL